MIRYSLRCAEGHAFESWFRDSAAFDKLAASNSLACAICGDSRVEKAIMAPALAGSERTPSGAESDAPAAQDNAGGHGADSAEQPQLLSGPGGRVEQALNELRRHLAAKADYVGQDFSNEARRIHLGESDERAIWGEASPDEAKALVEEGIPVAPLPFLNRRDD